MMPKPPTWIRARTTAKAKATPRVGWAASHNHRVRVAATTATSPLPYLEAAVRQRLVARHGQWTRPPPDSITAGMGLEERGTSSRKRRDRRGRLVPCSFRLEQPS